MNRQRPLPLLLVAVLLPALISLYGIVQRYRVEARNRAVAIATELEHVEAFGAAAGLPREEALTRLQARGLNAIVLGEETVNDLLVRGEAVLEMTYAENPSGAPGADIPALRFSDPRNIERVRRGLRIRFGELATNLPVRQSNLLLPAVGLNLIRTTPIGLNPADAKLVDDHDLFMIGRHGNLTGVTAQSVAATLAWSKELGMDVFLPQGDQVLGRRGALPALAESLRALHLYYASVEFGKIGGDSQMVGRVPERVIRLHSAQAAELDRLTEADAIERYGKAARERNMRILLVRPLDNAGSDPFEGFAGFIGKIAARVTAEGNLVGIPHNFGDTRLPRAYFLLLGLSVVPAVAWVIHGFTSDRRAIIGGSAIAAALGLLCFLPTGRELTALLASIAFPVLAYVALETIRPRSPIVGFLLVTGISVVGGLFVAGMLNGLSYFIGADQPAGVKISIFLPILIVGGFLLLKLGDLAALARQPITWGSAALSVGVGAILALLIARSGNDTGAGASGLEMVFRNWLDGFLFVRPRTKEFLIGHPALIVGLGMLAHIGKYPAVRSRLLGWTCLALMLGAVGQTGIVNTLWHLHIPVALSLVRIVLGAGLGCTIGLGLWLLLRKRLPTGEEGS